MKKVILITGIVMLYAVSGFAATAATLTVPTVLSGFTKSKNVAAAYASDNGGTTVPIYYSIATRHASGSKKFGAISTDAGMYSIDSSTALATTDIPTLPTSSTSTVSGWSSM